MDEEEKDEFAEVIPPKNPKKLPNDDLLEDPLDFDDEPVAAVEPDEVSLEDAATKEEEEEAEHDSYDDVDLW